MYAVDGSSDLEEQILDHWEGYCGSAPVRIGNGAADQLQLDIYGELVDSIYLYNKHGRPISHDAWMHLSEVVDWVCKNWDQADEGIWETRGGRQHFTYSRLMCWVAVERAVRVARQRGLPADLVAWMKTRDEIYHQIMDKGWNEERGAFVQHYGSDVLDASNLLMPLVKFVSPTDPRWLSTLDLMTEELVSDTLVYRYNARAAPDGLEGDEGTSRSAPSGTWRRSRARVGSIRRASPSRRCSRTRITSVSSPRRSARTASSSATSRRRSRTSRSSAPRRTSTASSARRAPYRRTARRPSLRSTASSCRSAESRALVDVDRPLVELGDVEDEPGRP